MKIKNKRLKKVIISVSLWSLILTGCKDDSNIFKFNPTFKIENGEVTGSFAKNQTHKFRFLVIKTMDGNEVYYIAEMDGNYLSKEITYYDTETGAIVLRCVNDENKNILSEEVDWYKIYTLSDTPYFKKDENNIIDVKAAKDEMINAYQKEMKEKKRKKR